MSELVKKFIVENGYTFSASKVVEVEGKAGKEFRVPDKRGSGYRRFGLGEVFDTKEAAIDHFLGGLKRGIEMTRDELLRREESLAKATKDLIGDES